MLAGRRSRRHRP